MKLNKHKTIIFVSVILLILLIVIFTICSKKEKYISTNAGVVSAKKIEWGIKRSDNHDQPDVGKESQKVLEENGGIYLGNKDKKNIYLTFDEGYEAGYTSEILKTLKENDVKATFFITGHYLNTSEDLVKQMLEDGHIVGNHTVNHKSMPSLTDDQIEKEVMDLHKSVYEKFAYEMKYIRPPKGEYSEQSLKVTNSLGYKTVLWSFAYADWDENKQPGEAEAKEKIISNVHNGEIMLLHATSETNTKILGKVIQEIKGMGYEFKSLDSFE